MFKCNVGLVDRIVRVSLGLVLIALGVYFNTWWGAIGVIPLVTAAIGWCPVYRSVGMTTCSTQS